MTSGFACATGARRPLMQSTVVQARQTSRLRGRSSESEASMQRRVAAARAEAGCYVDYDYVVINDQLEPTVVRLQEIIAAERSRTHRMRPVAEDIIKTFQNPIITEG